MSDVRCRVDGPVGHVLLNRPQARNAVTVGLARELATAVETLAHEVRVIVIRGAGADFCAGGDVRALAELHERGRAAMAELFTEFRRALTTITSVPVPVVAAVHGHAVAGGFELMQACDIAVVRTDARIADIHSRFGQVPGGGSTQRLPRIVGRQRAMGLILTGDEITGAQAVAWGLAYRAAEPGRFDEEVDALVARLLANPPAALAHSKFLVGQALERPLADGLPIETTRVLDHLEAEGQAAFGAFTRRKATT
ncbi:enoyl-CoA hydratase/isomerase family protein [Amycolatopsis sp. K13G38]|uniref:Enoyl-CoA hydratase/isomerase family protein n=1 Tax=Amycolatopsis acididurans TaxID=2724524 RepID=A0ABX1JI48_9PSEU|nr:enoyl-CoA hydratase/isomerase family protein [Amycolatopsis acididurans]NKQ57922.1 enoyl-CoA hydratase/isomerase family protein [Amycolatopsis acididurans]